MDQYTEANQLNWDERVLIHVASESYDVDSFVAGRCSLNQLRLVNWAMYPENRFCIYNAILVWIRFHGQGVVQ